MKKIVLTLSLFVAGMGAAFSQASAIWSPKNINIDTSWGVRYMSAVDANIAWAIAYDASTAFNRATDTFVVTTNGGTSFMKGTFFADTNTYSPSNISAINATTAFISAYPKVAELAGHNTTGISSKVIRTINGGVNFTLISDSLTMFNGVDNFIDWVYFWDVNNGIAMGDPNGS
ncbi:MAG: hypothetical protein ABI388_00260, partial [Bacteroidia bacterium]